MLRPFLGCLFLLSLPLVAPAEQFKGKIKSVAADKDTLTVTVGKNDQKFVVPATAKVLSANGKDIPQRLMAKLFQAGVQVVVVTEKIDDKDVVKEVKLLDPFPINGYLSAEEAGSDFALQGEYEGTLNGKGKLAAQVVAGNEGQFTVLFLNGGLAGAGWDGKLPDKAAAKTDNAKTSFLGANWAGTIADGKLVGKAPSGEEFALSRVMRHSPAEGAKPPRGAVVLFDGTSVEHWTNGKIVDGQFLLAGATTKQPVVDFKLHVEFRLPFRDKSQGNSGVYMQERYEIQIINSFGRFPPPNNGIASIYTQTAPAINMSYPPLSWQTYDIDFKAAKWDPAGKKTANATVTVVHNGVKVHDNAEIKNKTGAGKEEGPNPLPIYLQNHGSPVWYRNIWIVTETVR